eukprot:5914472-Pleurochrysis_carterae.AAC.1
MRAQARAHTLTHARTCTCALARPNTSSPTRTNKDIAAPTAALTQARAALHAHERPRVQHARARAPATCRISLATISQACVNT